MENEQPQSQPAGRPAHIHHPGTEFVSNPEHRALVLEAVRNGVSASTAMKKLGYSTTLMHWREVMRLGHWGQGGPVKPETLVVIREFMEALEQARAEGEQRLVEIVADAAGRVNEKTGLVDWQPAKFLLTHGGSRENFYPHQEPQVVDMTHHGSSAPEFRAAKDMTEAELVEGLDDPEWAQALLPRTVKSE